MDEVLVMTPLPRFLRWGMRARQGMKVPPRLIARTRSQSSMERSEAKPSEMMPALLTRMSGTPIREIS